MQEFSRIFKAEPWLAVKFSTEWRFFKPEDLKQTGKALVVTNEGQSKVVLLRPSPAVKGERKFVPYCSFSWHQDIVLSGYQVCENRQCVHYRRLYLDGATTQPHPLGTEPKTLDNKCDNVGGVVG